MIRRMGIPARRARRLRVGDPLPNDYQVTGLFVPANCGSQLPGTSKAQESAVPRLAAPRSDAQQIGLSEMEALGQHKAKLDARDVLRLAGDTPGVADRLLVPERISAQRVVGGDPESIRGAVDAWMTNQEGMRKRSEDETRTVWEKGMLCLKT